MSLWITTRAQRIEGRVKLPRGRQNRVVGNKDLGENDTWSSLKDAL